MVSKALQQIHINFQTHRLPPWIIYTAFYIFLLLVPNNKVMGICIAITGVLLWRKIKNIFAVFYFLLVLCLPFTKGKGFQFELLNTWQTKLTLPYTFDFDITFWGMTLLFLIYLLIRNRKQLKTIAMQRADIFLLLFYLSCLPSIVYASYPHIASLGFIELTHVVLLYYVTRLVQHVFHTSQLSIIMAIQLSFQGVVALGQFLLRRPLGISLESSGGELAQNNAIEYAFEQVGFFRSRGTFDHSNTLGSFAASFLPMFVILLLYKKNTVLERVLYLAGSIAGAISVVVSGSRTSIAISLVFFFLLYMIRRKQNKPVFLWSKMVARLTIIISLFALLTIIIPRMAQLASTLRPGGGLSYRVGLLESAAAMVRNNFFGVGLGLFPKEVFTDIETFTSYPAQPHNLFAQIAAEGGVLALGFFLLFLADKMTRAIGNIIKTKDIYAIAITTSLSIMLMLSQVYPFLLRSAIFPYMMLFLAKIG